MKDSFSAFLLALGIAIAGIAIAFSISSFKNFDHYVSVKGLAEKTVKSNDAIWQIRLNVADDDLSAVYKQVNDAQMKITNFLTLQGFKPAEIQLMSIDITDNAAQAYSGAGNKNVKRYSANSGVILHSALVDNVVTAQQKIGQLVQNGIVLSQSQVSYYFTQLNDVKPAMLDEATANAKKSAESFAHNANNALGKIRTASQGLVTIEDLAKENYGQNSSVMKNIRLVTSVEYFLQ
jgi:hypothetical protein